MRDLSKVDSEILEAAQFDSVIKACLMQYQNGDVGYQETLKTMVVVLLKEKIRLQRELTSKVALHG